MDRNLERSRLQHLELVVNGLGRVLLHARPLVVDAGIKQRVQHVDDLVEHGPGSLCSG